MCGIAGIYNYAVPRAVEKGDVSGMCDAMIHRGPDEEGYYFAKVGPDGFARLGLGMRRLSIIDLRTGSQPIHNEDKSVWVVLNGEIYNFAELRARLETKHRFYTTSDTETIVHLYEEMGEACVEELRGMFAFALWDDKNKKLVLARDRIGKKPLYYENAGGSIVFASEIQALLARHNRLPQIDAEALDLFLTYQYVPSPRTIFSSIKSLPPSTVMTCRCDGKIEMKKYWSLDYRRKTSMSFEESCAEIRRLVEEATRLRMIADVPLGAFLSGGHDSSIVVGTMSRISSSPVRTFSIGFEEEDFSELAYARMIAERYNTDHSEFIVKPDYCGLLPTIVKHYGQPYADSSALPTFIVARETRKNVTVALTGDGGDETFGGYLRYKAMKGSLYFSFPFKMLGKSLTGAAARLIPRTETAKGRNLFRYASRLVCALADPPARRHIQWHAIFTDEAKAALYSDEMKSRLAGSAYSYIEEIFDSAPASDVMDKTFYTDIATYLPECLMVKMDIASMANSLEARSPLLDHKLVEFSAALPSSWKVRGLDTKYILKKAFEEYLPPAILRRGKQGFGAPVGKWFRGEWKNYFREVALSDRALARGYFKKDALERIYNEHASGARDHGYRLWALLMLELWHNVFVDKNIKAD